MIDCKCGKAVRLSEHHNDDGRVFYLEHQDGTKLCEGSVETVRLTDTVEARDACRKMLRAWDAHSEEERYRSHVEMERQAHEEDAK